MRRLSSGLPEFIDISPLSRKIKIKREIRSFIQHKKVSLWTGLSLLIADWVLAGGPYSTALHTSAGR